MKLSRTLISTLMAGLAGIVVGLVLVGSTYAAAASLLDGNDIQNGSLEGVDIDNGTLSGADIRNNSLDARDIAPDALDLGRVTASSAPGANGAVTWDGPAGLNNALVSMNYVVRGCSACAYTLTLTTTPEGASPVVVTSCTVPPGGGTCSAAGFAASLTAPTVAIEGDMLPDNPPTLEGSITAVAVND